MDERALSVLIVEEDPFFAKQLEQLIRSVGYRVTAIVDQLDDKLRQATAASDLILMNSNKEENAKEIGMNEFGDCPIPIVFITQNNKKKLNQKTDFAPIGYLVESLTKRSLRSAIETAILSIDEQKVATEKVAFSDKEFFYFKRKSIYHKVYIENIFYIKADDDYSITYTVNNVFSSSIRLVEMEELLKDHSFLRVHRSYIVNLEKIELIDPEQNRIVIENTPIPISRRAKSLLLNQIKIIK